MKKIAMLGLALMAATAAMPSQAAVTVSSTAANSNPYFTLDLGGMSGKFGDTLSGSFTDTYTFTVPYTGDISSLIGATTVNLTNKYINFTSVLFNGESYDVLSKGKNQVFTFDGDLKNTNTITISGNVIGAAASYSGTVEFVPTAAVPEPASWALMIGGFGLLGGALRRQYRKSENRFTAKVRAVAMS
jgi:hypothetical protein